MADAGSGDIWLGSPVAVYRVAPGPGAPDDLIGSIIQPVEVDGHIVNRISFDFSQAVYVERIGRGHYLSAFSDRKQKLLTFYEQRPGAPAAAVSTWNVNPSVMVRYDRETFVVLELSSEGWSIKRIRLPVPRP